MAIYGALSSTIGFPPGGAGSEILIKDGGSWAQEWEHPTTPERYRARSVRAAPDGTLFAAVDDTFSGDDLWRKLPGGVWTEVLDTGTVDISNLSVLSADEVWLSQGNHVVGRWTSGGGYSSWNLQAQVGGGTSFYDIQVHAFASNDVLVVATNSFTLIKVAHWDGATWTLLGQFTKEGNGDTLSAMHVDGNDVFIGTGGGIGASESSLKLYHNGARGVGGWTNLSGVRNISTQLTITGTPGGSVWSIQDNAGRFRASDAGKDIIIFGSPNPANNGTFPITVYNNNGNVTYTNPTGVNQSITFFHWQIGGLGWPGDNNGGAGVSGIYGKYPHAGEVGCLAVSIENNLSFPDVLTWPHGSGFLGSTLNPGLGCTSVYGDQHGAELGTLVVGHVASSNVSIRQAGGAWSTEDTGSAGVFAGHLVTTGQLSKFGHNHLFLNPVLVTVDGVSTANASGAISTAGGDEVTILMGGLGLAEGTDVVVRLGGVLAFGGQGFGYVPQVGAANAITVFAPPLPKGLADVSVTVVSTSEEFSLTGGVTVLERNWPSKLFESRKSFPRWQGVGNRSLDGEDDVS